MATYPDLFNRAAENPLSGGPGWTTAPGLSAMQVNGSNQCIPTLNVDSGSRITSTSGTDTYAECKVPTGGNNGPMLRCKTSGAVKGGVVLACASGNVIAYRMDSGAYTNIWSNGFTFTSSDVIRLAVVGTTFTVSKNGSAQGTTFTETAYSGELGFGLWCYNGTQGVLDDFDGSDGAAAGGAGKVIPEAMALQPMTGLY